MAKTVDVKVYQRRLASKHMGNPGLQIFAQKYDILAWHISCMICRAITNESLQTPKPCWNIESVNQNRVGIWSKIFFIMCLH